MRPTSIPSSSPAADPAAPPNRTFTVAGHLLTAVAPGEGVDTAVLESGEGDVRAALAAIPLARLRSAGLLDPLLRLAQGGEEPQPEAESTGELIDEMDVEELIRESVDGGSPGTAPVDPEERRAG